MTFQISNQDVHTNQGNRKSLQTKRQHCCDPQCSSIYGISILHFSWVEHSSETIKASNPFAFISLSWNNDKDI